MNSTSPSDTSNLLACPTCNKTFKRQEHLKRHALTHSNERRFKCQHCDKEFLRRDALQRHEHLHNAPGPSLLQRGARACLNCATAKVRCIGDARQPCTRCLQRAMECRYPDHDSTDFQERDEQPESTRDLFQSPSTAGHSMTVAEGFPPPPITNPSQIGRTFGGLNELPFDPTYWNSDALANINWLPNDIPNESLDNFAWSLNDTQFWDAQGIPFSLSPVGHNTNTSNQTPPVDAPTVSTDSPTESSAQPNEETVSGEFYVDGNEARLPRVKRRKLGSSRVGQKVSAPIDSHFSLGSWPASLSQVRTEGRVHISQSIYSDLREAFVILCLENNPRPFTIVHSNGQASTQLSAATVFEPDLPPKEIFDNLLNLYIESFHATMPILHLEAFYPKSWQLVLAMCGIGSHFVGDDSDRFVVALHEFIRRALHASEDDPTWLPSRFLEAAQMKLLSVIGLLYCGDQRLHNYGLKSWPALAAGVDRLWHNRIKAGDRDSHWEAWIRVESSRRTAHAVWLLDSMLAFHFHRKNMLQTDQSGATLPCHERVWTATTEEEWKRLIEKFGEPPTLDESLRRLYIEKNLSSDMGEFSRILVIHGIFRRTWDVESYLSQPFSRWTPTAQKQSAEETDFRTPTWLPSVPLYTKWRNSACDCLDILHWSANATIGTASGMEHPTVMHLHLARVVLLTPHLHFVRLAQYLSGETHLHSEDAAVDRKMIQRWATQDHFKARLAMIHAGVMFWHVRRFSANGFYEPSSVVLATLALWAFSAFSVRPKSPASGANNRSEPVEEPNQQADNVDGNPGAADSSQDDEEDAYDIILLDRPTDDELVQQFVRRGHTMKANMNGVGDLYEERGAERVLIEGRKLLRTLNCWGIKDRWVRVLDKLITVTRQQRKSVLDMQGASA